MKLAKGLNQQGFNRLVPWKRGLSFLGVSLWPCIAQLNKILFNITAFDHYF